jgi:hypothetical protein
VEVGDGSSEKSYGRNPASHGNVGIWCDRKFDVAWSFNSSHLRSNNCIVCFDPVEEQAITTAFPVCYAFSMGSVFAPPFFAVDNN